VTPRDSEIDVLDPRFPIRLTMPESLFWDAVHLEPYRPCVESLAWRARAQAAQHQERFVTPRWVPERAHEDTAADMGFPAGWLKETAAREGMPQPEDTDTFIVASLRAEAEEVAAAERHPLRRIGRLLAITKGD
jgi:hypothetical protein